MPCAPPLLQDHGRFFLLNVVYAKVLFPDQVSERHEKKFVNVDFGIRLNLSDLFDKYLPPHQGLPLRKHFVLLLSQPVHLGSQALLLQSRRKQAVVLVVLYGLFFLLQSALFTRFKGVVESLEDRTFASRRYRLQLKEFGGGSVRR